MGKFNNRRKHSASRGGRTPYRKRGRASGRGRQAAAPPRSAEARTRPAVTPAPAPAPPPALAPALAESESEEELTPLEEVLQLVGGRRRRAVAVESDEDSEEEEEEQGQRAGEADRGGEMEDLAMEDGQVEDIEEKDLSHGVDENEDDGDDEEDEAGLDSAGEEKESGGEETEDGNLDEEDTEGSPTTPFSRHFEVNLPEPVGEFLQTAARWQSERLQWPRLGALVVQHRPVEAAAVPLSAVERAEEVRLYSRPDVGRHLHPAGYNVRQQIAANVAAVNEKLFSRSLTELQQEMLSLISEYRDLYYPHRTLQNEDELRLAYCAHALSHVLRTRSRIVHHNSKVSKKEDVPDSYRDQGLTRPKVLIVAPFKHSAFRIVNTLVSLLQPAGQSSVLRFKRFCADFGGDEAPAPAPGRAQRPADFLATFAGNTDDAFRIGLQVTKKSMRLYSDFYHSDVIVTSPLGLRTVLGAEGEPDRDVDFLNSIEMLIMDQADVFLMQNWEHVLHLMEHLHLQPRDSHGVDFSRVRYWTLNGWQKLYRQTLVFSAVPTPEINALVSKNCLNYAGRVIVQNPEDIGAIQQVVVQVPQVFHRFSSESLASEPDDRFQFFVEKILPQYRDAQMSHTLLLVPSYFDYVRIRNHFIKETVNFVQVCEYTKDSRVSRARDMFYHGKRHFLLYTERFHFFRRYRIKGIRHVVFYGLPMYPHLYSEICNLMQEAYQNPRMEQGGSGLTCTVLFSKFDRLKLARVVGAERATSMIAAEKQVHMFVTGES